MGLKKKFAIVFLTILFSLLPAQASAQTVTSISDQLICQCGCTAVLTNCTHAECMVRDEMTTLIKQKLEQGQTEAQIVQFFVAQYGEQVLASPPKKGFNLTAWILPFAAILAGGGVIYVAVRRWVRRGESAQADTGVEAEEVDYVKYQHQLEKELAEYSERSFR